MLSGWTRALVVAVLLAAVLQVGATGPASAQAQSGFGPGDHLVGPDISAGRYVALNVENCSWGRTFLRFGSEALVGDQVLAAEQVIVDIAPDDVAFTSSGCGNWIPVEQAALPAVDSFGDGSWLVGTQVSPGRYVTLNSDDECSWARVSGFGGVRFDDVLSQSPPYAAPQLYAGVYRSLVDIAPDDAGFISSGCGVWIPVEQAGLSEVATPGDGSWLIGTQVAAGRYVASNPGLECEWYRLSGLGGRRDTIGTSDLDPLTYKDLNTDIVLDDADQSVVDIAPDDVAFVTKNCGVWVPVQQAGLSPVDSFGPGEWIVGTQVSGRYVALNPDETCEWQRLSGFGGRRGFGDNPTDVIRRSDLFFAEQQVVDIAPDDVGFTSSNCGVWTAVELAGLSVVDSFGDGHWIVGTQVSPGWYKRQAGLFCRWERLSGFGEEVAETLLRGGGNEEIEVYIAPTDAGFRSDECGVWESVDPTCLGLPVTIDLNSNGGNGQGGPGDDVIVGTPGPDIISSGDGNDTICSGDGNDVIDSGAGDDVVVAGRGEDIIDGGAGSDELDGEEGNDTIFGGVGDDSIRGGEGFDGDDTIDSGAGDDTVDSGNGDNVVDGGAGDDTIDSASGDDTIYGGDGNDTIDSGAGDDTIDSGDGDDTIDSGRGHNIINSGSGDDSVLTGWGDDTIDGGAGFDVLDGGAGDDTIYGGDNADQISGGPGDDFLYGQNGWDRISGRDGQDTIEGGQGNDWVWGGPGHDDIDGGTGNDLLLGGTQGDDTIRAGGGNDKMNGMSGNDDVEGGNGFDQIWGGVGDDYLKGGGGIDWIWGRWGEDTIEGGFGDDQLFGEESADLIHGGPGNDLINGGIGTDDLRGNAGNDTIEGGDQDDVMAGGAGNDSFDGGFGTDSCNGNTGTDTAVNCETLTNIS